MTVIDWEALRNRYQEVDVSTRLGALASNLSRIHSLSLRGEQSAVVIHLIRESQFLIEWTAPNLEIEFAAELVELQRLLGSWYYHWDEVWTTPEQRNQLIKQSQYWAEFLLQRSQFCKTI
ncbi:hypothetical protein IQ250_27695 [Pseudanabaenaceae cyanobacterium LEGE 13415]|nr:hypothetical protein [Pseudanabaenaceae cyanobacterium LEGE 13415]